MTCERSCVILNDKKIIKLQWRIGKMRILICDDEQKLIDLELSILQEYCRSTNIAATFFTFTDSLSAGNIGEFDIAFLDIDMEKLNGIDFVLNSIIENKQYAFHDLRLIPYIKSWYKNNRITERQCAAAISANSCCANQTLTLAPNGDIFTCDLIDHTPIGNVYNIDLNDFALSDLLRKTNMKGCSIV